MKKKILHLFLILTIIFSIGSNLYAENRDMANKIFNGDFKSFFIGKISEMDNKSFIIKIEKTFMGKDLDVIQVKKFNEYSFSELAPHKNDIVVAILKNDDTIDETWVFKATSSNYQTLFLANDKDPKNEDVILFQNYINSGTYIEDRTATSDDKKQEKKEVEKEVEKPKKTTESDFSDFDKKTEVFYSFLKSPIKVIGIGVIFVAIYFVLNSSKNFRKDVEKDDFDEYGDR